MDPLLLMECKNHVIRFDYIHNIKAFVKSITTPSGIIQKPNAYHCHHLRSSYLRWLQFFFLFYQIYQGIKGVPHISIAVVYTSHILLPLSIINSLKSDESF